MSHPHELYELLDLFCPMHVVLDHEGRVLHAGDTLRKLLPGTALVGYSFFDQFEILRPRAFTSMTALRAEAGKRLRLRKQGTPRTILKGVLYSFENGRISVINLSFGFSVLDAVRDYALTSADFAATDLTIEMLYLVEAKSAAMEASRKLNLRLQGAKIAAEEQAFTDTLTGLKNRRALDTILARWLQAGRALTLVQMDLDFFKSVNDRLGHAAGDHVLQTVARILVEETRDEDCVARVGGDEFVLLLAGRMAPEKMASFAARLISRIEAPIPFKGEACRISTSLGFTRSSVADDPSAEDLLEQADAALYAAKRQGRAQHKVYAPKMSLVLPQENKPSGGPAPPLPP
ncbi:diguanylate cyclase [Shimia sp. SDUM112013]|uniref:diguanylate cyclase n=1 Tax=Shimia sp. SDUM112013 TaxID=3136160 RepID=UPI0032EEBD53